MDETQSVGADHMGSEAQQPQTRGDSPPKKTAVVVQAVVADKQWQMEMDFGSKVTDIAPEKRVGDDQVATAIDSLGELEATIKQNP